MQKIISYFLIKRGFIKLAKEIKLINNKNLDSIQTIDFLFSKKAELIKSWQFKEESFTRLNQTIELIRDDSHSEKTFNKLKILSNGQQIDYLFIDGDHTYEGAKKDFETYKKLVKKGGLIGFHDIVVHHGSACNVYKLWNEVKKDYPHKEFVNDWNQNCFGIGLIEKH